MTGQCLLFSIISGESPGYRPNHRPTAPTRLELSMISLGGSFRIFLGMASDCVKTNRPKMKRKHENKHILAKKKDLPGVNPVLGHT